MHCMQVIEGVNDWVVKLFIECLLKVKVSSPRVPQGRVPKRWLLGGHAARVC